MRNKTRKLPTRAALLATAATVCMTGVVGVSSASAVSKWNEFGPGGWSPAKAVGSLTVKYGQTAPPPPFSPYQQVVCPIDSVNSPSMASNQAGGLLFVGSSVATCANGRQFSMTFTTDDGPQPNGTFKINNYLGYAGTLPWAGLGSYPQNTWLAPAANPGSGSTPATLTFNNDRINTMSGAAIYVSGTVEFRTAAGAPLTYTP